LYQLDGQDPIAQTSDGTPVQLSLGNSNNMKFLNISLKGLAEGTEMEMLIPSHWLMVAVFKSFHIKSVKIYFN
jgi:hypothetical protein